MDRKPYPDTNVDIESAKPLENMCVLVAFANGDIKTYDVKQLFDELPQFKVLEDINIFNGLKYGRYAVYWNNELDIAETELWYNGIAYNLSDLK